MSIQKQRVFHVSNLAIVALILARMQRVQLRRD